MKTPENRILIYLVSSKVTSVSGGVEVLKDITNQMKQAKARLEEFRNEVRSARDADPNWTDMDIDLMILNQLNEELSKKGRRTI